MPPRGPRRLDFRDERTGGRRAPAWFDGEAKPLAMEYKDPRRVDPLPLNAQDRLSFLLALSFLPGRAESTSFAVFDGRGQSRQEDRTSGRQRPKPPAGECDAVGAERITGNGEAR